MDKDELVDAVYLQFQKAFIKMLQERLLSKVAGEEVWIIYGMDKRVANWQKTELGSSSHYFFCIVIEKLVEYTGIRIGLQLFQI